MEQIGNIPALPLSPLRRSGVQAKGRKHVEILPMPSPQCKTEKDSPASAPLAEPTWDRQFAAIFRFKDKGVQEVKSSQRDSHPAREGKLLKQSRVQLRRRLKLLTISEHEEFDDGRHEC